MKRILVLLAAAAALCACSQEKKVMARFVPERSDDFVFENNLIAGRFYGEALEGNPTSPGIDIWVKLPGKLVANEWYKGYETQSDEYYHHDHGGKDCYKVAVSLGGGASAPLFGSRLAMPPTNYRSWEILEQKPGKVVFVLHYPEWQAAEGIHVALDKKVTVTADSYFCRVDDSYSFTGTEQLCVAAGLLRHGAQQTIVDEMKGADRYAIWEHASDQSVEPEDGLLGVAVIVPGAHQVLTDKELDHSLCTRIISPGETFTYWFGSCWSKGDIRTAEAWFAEVNKRK